MPRNAERVVNSLVITPMVGGGEKFKRFFVIVANDEQFDAFQREIQILSHFYPKEDGYKVQIGATMRNGRRDFLAPVWIEWENKFNRAEFLAMFDDEADHLAEHVAAP